MAAAQKVCVEEVRGILAGANPVIGLTTPSDTDPEHRGRNKTPVEPRRISEDATSSRGPDNQEATQVEGSA